ncbi:MAG: hypothetical protein JXB42_06260 [Deltaproteobacteria bacterium]|nr:hypothetical protein [Deltaproteobacteria bacterium]
MARQLSSPRCASRSPEGQGTLFLKGAVLTVDRWNFSVIDDDSPLDTGPGASW